MITHPHFQLKHIPLRKKKMSYKNEPSKDEAKYIMNKIINSLNDLSKYCYEFQKGKYWKAYGKESLKDFLKPYSCCLSTTLFNKFTKVGVLRHKLENIHDISNPNFRLISELLSYSDSEQMHLILKILIIQNKDNNPKITLKHFKAALRTLSDE